MSQTESEQRILRQVEWILGGACVVAAFCLSALPTLLPCQDAPAHWFDVWVHTHRDTFAGLLTTQFPLQSAGFVLPAWLLATVTDPFVATRAVLLGTLVLLSLSFVRIARHLGGSPGAALAGAAFSASGWFWVMGFFNFIAALATGAAGVALMLGSGRVVRALGSLLLAASVFAHLPGGAVMVGLAAVLLPGRRGVVAAISPVLPAALLVGLQALRIFAQPGVADGSTAPLFAFKPPLEAWALAFRASGESYSGVSAWAAAVAWIVALVATGLRVRALGSARAAAVDPAVRLGVVAALVVALFPLVPWNLGFWAHAGPRVLVLGPIAAWLLLPATGRGRWLSSAALLVAVLGLWRSVPRAIAEGERLATAASRFAPIPVGRTFNVVYGPEAIAGNPPLALPMLHCHYWGVVGGGVFPDMFAYNPMVHSVLFARPRAEMFGSSSGVELVSQRCVETPGCINAAAEGDRIAARSLSFDTVLQCGAPDAVLDRLELRGLQRVSTGTWRVRPVRLGASIATGGATAGSLVLELFWPQSLGRVAGIAIPLNAQTGPLVRVDLGPFASGPLVMRAWVEQDGNGVADPADVWIAQDQEVMVPLTPGYTLEVGPQGSE